VRFNLATAVLRDEQLTDIITEFGMNQLGLRGEASTA